VKVGVVGSRTFNDYGKLKNILDSLEGVELVVSGGARGADSMGERWAKEKGIPTKIFLPDWNKFGKRAGFIRNEDIVRECDTLVAFWDGESHGTLNSINHAKRMEKRLIIERFVPKEYTDG